MGFHSPLHDDSQWHPLNDNKYAWCTCTRISDTSRYFQTQECMPICIYIYIYIYISRMHSNSICLCGSSHESQFSPACAVASASAANASSWCTKHIAKACTQQSTAKAYCKQQSILQCLKLVERWLPLNVFIVYGSGTCACMTLPHPSAAHSGHARWASILAQKAVEGRRHCSYIELCQRSWRGKSRSWSCALQSEHMMHTCMRKRVSLRTAAIPRTQCLPRSRGTP